MDRPKIICLCGSSRFVDTMAVVAWTLEKEGAIVLGLHPPCWYTKEESHQAEFEGIAEQMDELHQRGHTEYEDRMLHHILDCRYDRQRQTILISNEDPERFCESIGSAVVDRMEESGVLLKCDWQSFRDRK